MSDLSLGGKALVQAAKRADRPNDADRARVLEALRGRLGDAAVLGTTLGQAAAATREVAAWGTKFAKWGWVGPTALVAGALLFAPRFWPTAVNAVPSASAGLTPLAPSPASLESAAPELAPAPVDAPIAPLAPSSSSRPVELQKAPRSRDGLAEEVVLLSRAQTELRAGRPANALLALNEHQRKFPRGTLAEERTAARIQALCALGRTDEANAQLKQLASISPNSAHQERARQACRKAGVAP